jgi:hypothetical protein
MKVVVNKTNWMEISGHLLEVIRRMDSGLILFQNFWALVAELVINHNHDFKIEIEIDEKNIIIHPHNVNTVTSFEMAEIIEMAEKYSNEELRELWKSSIHSENIGLLRTLSLARIIKKLKTVIKMDESRYEIKIAIP